jgi:hypothetical protein
VPKSTHTHALLLPLVRHCHSLSNDNHAGNWGGQSEPNGSHGSGQRRGHWADGGTRICLQCGICPANASKMRWHCLANDNHACNQGRQPKVAAVVGSWWRWLMAVDDGGGQRLWRTVEGGVYFIEVY